MLTVVHDMTPCSGDSPFRHRDLITYRAGSDMRASRRRLATVATISGDIDATNITRITAHFMRLVVVGNALLLDLSGVEFFAARCASALLAVDQACQRSDLPWALLTNHAVDRALLIGDRDDILRLRIRRTTRCGIS